MGRKKPVCLDREREFRIEELFFSTTDPRGVIQSGNDVFVRVSGYEEAELLGMPHSKIRHPDMPASVFRVFWDMLQSDKSIAAYVKNRAKDGEYYWVMAVATPVQGGYLSVRLKPSSPQLATVSEMYARVLADEEAAAEEGLSKEGIVEVGLASLTKEIESLGFSDYVAFMQHSLAAESVSRQQQLPDSVPDRNASMPHANEQVEARRILSDIEFNNAKCDECLVEMLGAISSLEHSNKNFLDACESMSEQSDMISVVALNSNVSATTRTLEAISGELAAAEKDNRELLTRMVVSVDQVSQSLSGLSFNISVAALQSEIGSHFLQEIQASDATPAVDNLITLLAETDARLQTLFEQLTHAGDWFRDLASLTDNLHRNAKTLRFIRMAGVTEATQLPPGHAFAGLFDEVNANIMATTEICTTLRDEIQDSQSVIRSLAATKSKLNDRLDQIRSQVPKLKDSVESSSSANS
ncbi:MAG: PAS domain-containing protein [Planctomycetota bacterium]